MTADPKRVEQKLQELSDAVWRGLRDETVVPPEPTGELEVLDSLTEGIQVILSAFEQQRGRESETSQRLTELTETMVSLAAREFNNLAPLRRDGGPFDTVAIGLRMLGEELEGSTVSNDYVLSIINSMTDVLFVIAPDGSIQTVNTAACRLTGQSEDELLGKSFSLLLGEGGLPSVPRLLETNGTAGLDLTFTGKDGVSIPMQVNASVTRDGDGRDSAVIIVGRDMRETRRLLAAEAASAAEKAKADELKKAYDDLRETQLMLVQTAKLTALGELAASVAHELNQPLNNIKLITQGILRDIREQRHDPSTLEEDGAEIVGVIDKMADIINHMRTFARKPDEKRREPIDLSKTMLDALRMLREQLRLNGVRLEERLATNLPPVIGDPNNIEQVMLNLLTNARDAVLARLQTEPGFEGQITVRTVLLDDGRLSVEVTDNGEGVPESIIDKLFEPFFTTKEPGKGTGLGLAIAQRVAEEYGGEIRAESERGEGATFRLLLPQARAD